MKTLTLTLALATLAEVLNGDMDSEDAAAFLAPRCGRTAALVLGVITDTIDGAMTADDAAAFLVS